MRFRSRIWVKESEGGVGFGGGAYTGESGNDN
jgi:hypothetical protein